MTPFHRKKKYHTCQICIKLLIIWFFFYFFGFLSLLLKWINIYTTTKIHVLSYFNLRDEYLPFAKSKRNKILIYFDMYNTQSVCFKPYHDGRKIKKILRGLLTRFLISHAKTTTFGTKNEINFFSPFDFWYYFWINTL